MHNCKKCSYRCIYLRRAKNPSSKILVQNTMQHSINLLSTGWSDYALIDSGDGRKLERFGPYHIIRPEPQALWSPYWDEKIWQNHVAEFTAQGQWNIADNLPEKWEMQFETIRFFAMPTAFRHLGFFPEQSPHWQWVAQHINTFIKTHHRPPRLLNLFAYSGVASLHALAAGAEVTHIDASKKAIAYAFDNRSLSGLDDAPIRLITEDATRFVEREIKRGQAYDGIIIDPPKYGRGPKGEIWQTTDHLPTLLKQCRSLLSPTAQFMIITLYAIRTSTLAVHSALADITDGLAGKIDSGELAITEDRPKGRTIGQALYARWSAE